MKKNWVSWYWQLRVVIALIAGVNLYGLNCALAQSKIVPDNTLGAERSVVQQDINGLPIEVISGGAIRGSNLFHSFLEFNVSLGRGAYFFSPNINIQNILARVTGSNPSEILGTLGTYGNSNPNLFLINPHGIIFGSNASLDMGNAGPNIGGTGGSFVATTANAVLLGNNGIFSASEPGKSNLLSVNPSAFLFNAISAQGIVNSSQAPAGVDSNGNTINGLRVPNGRSLLLVGGDVKLDSGNLFVQDGRVELGGVSGSGTVGLNVDGNHLSLSFPQQAQLADVSLTNGSGIEVNSSDSNSTEIHAPNQDILTGINITARSVAIANAGGLATIAIGQGDAGNITINARDQVSLNGAGIFSSVNSTGVGNAGNINITTGSLALTNGTLLSSATYGRGNAGGITINARDNISLDSSGIFSSVAEGAVGNGGKINITTGSLALTNSANLLTTTQGRGSADSITINARDTISLDNYSSIGSDVDPNAVGNGGKINITTRSLTLTNGGEVGTNTSGDGNAGDITINARDTLSLDGLEIDSNGIPIPSQISSGDLSLSQRTPNSLSNNVSSNIIGNEGNIKITTGSFKVTNGARLNTSNYSQGLGGDITINARDSVIFDGILDGVASGALSRVIPGAGGKSGNINITTGSLALTDGALLDNTTFGFANAGNITINARDTVTLNDSSVISAVADGAIGTGGTINITTGTLSITNGGQVNDSTNGQGDAGNVRINTRNLLTIDGVDSQGYPSGVFSRVNSPGVGKGGTIDIKAGSLALTNGAQLSARTDSAGDAGNVTIGTSGTLELNNSVIATNATSFGGGNITISAKDIQLRNNSLIRTDLSSGQGSGGNIALSANTILALEDSDILAFASQGRGGNITFNTLAFLSDPLYTPTRPITSSVNFNELRNNGRVDVNASGAVSGGNITGVTDTSFIQNSLNELPQNLINPNTLIANSCIARSTKQQGTFTITGSGGLPSRPGDASVSVYPTGDVRNVSGETVSHAWQKGDPIVEPQGVFKLPSGQLVLSRECF